jgi:15-cis-phytoene desaturase
MEGAVLSGKLAAQEIANYQPAVAKPLVTTT